MSREKKFYYGGLDWFRLIGAILIIAIHTSPFESYSENADMILCRIIARVAVPFFFMVTGYFGFKGRRNENNFYLRILKLYVISCIIYLPVLIYSGYFAGVPFGNLILKILKDIVFNGIYYHLWYFPAVLLGVFIVSRLIEHGKTKTLYAAVGILYLIGLLGDSYFGLIQRVPVVNTIYDVMFHLFEYTRNGIFFAPVFLTMGYFLKKRKKIVQLKGCVVGFLLSFAGMIGEGVALHHFQLTRHDSMYIMLIPVLYFLFQLLLYCRMESRKELREISMFVYVLHPLCIVGIRGFVKITGLSVFTENSLLYFAGVTVSAFAVSILVLLIKRKATELSGSRRGEDYDKEGKSLD